MAAVHFALGVLCLVAGMGFGLFQQGSVAAGGFAFAGGLCLLASAVADWAERWSTKKPESPQ
jgi:hypothetical protein